MTPRPVLWLAKGLGRGGAEQLLVDSLRYFDRDRFDVEVAYLLPWKDALVPRFEAAGVRTHCLRGAREADPRWALRLRELVHERNFELLHTHMPFPAVGARVALGARGPAMVHTEHNLWNRYRALTRWANALTYNRNDAVIAVSRAVADAIIVPRWVPGRTPRVDVVYQGADLASVRRGTEARAAARARLELPLDAPVIGTVANFTEKKDHATLLAAVTELARELPGLQWVLVGTGPLEHQLRAAVDAARLRESVRFVGMRDDVPEILPGFDVFSLSSRYEGLPISLLEAMASGVPPVVTAVGGIPEVVTDGQDGVLVPAGAPDALVAALRKLLTDGVRRSDLGDAARKRAMEFDLRDAVQRTERIYAEVLGR